MKTKKVYLNQYKKKTSKVKWKISRKPYLNEKKIFMKINNEENDFIVFFLNVSAC